MNSQITNKYLLLIFLSYTQIIEADSIHDDPNPSSLDGNISEVKSFGHWEKGEDSGELRLVIKCFNGDPSKYLFYIQWIKSELHESSKVVKTVAIEELNGWCYSKKIEYNNETNQLNIQYITRGELYSRTPWIVGDYHAQFNFSDVGSYEVKITKPQVDEKKFEEYKKNYGK